MKLGEGIKFIGDGGGIVTLSENATEIGICGLEDGYVFFDDIYLNPEDDMTVDVSTGETTITVEDSTEDTVVRFGMNSTIPSGLCDFRFEGLEPNNWFRLKFNGNIGKTRTGDAHKKSNDNGLLVLQNVLIPK